MNSASICSARYIRGQLGLLYMHVQYPPQTSRTSSAANRSERGSRCIFSPLRRAKTESNRPSKVAVILPGLRWHWDNYSDGGSQLFVTAIFNESEFCFGSGVWIVGKRKQNAFTSPIFQRHATRIDEISLNDDDLAAILLAVRQQLTNRGFHRLYRFRQVTVHGALRQPP